jgi:hypothetical protein
MPHHCHCSGTRDSGHCLCAGNAGRSQHAGRDTDPLLERAHIAPRSCSDPSARIPVDRYAELYNLINRELDDEGFGLFSLPIRAGTFEFLCRSVITAPTLAEAIDRSIRFLRLVLPDLAVSVSIATSSRPACASVENRPLTIGRSSPSNGCCACCTDFFPGSSGRSIVLDSVAFPYPRRQHAEDYALIYTAHSTFDAETLTAFFAANCLTCRSVATKPPCKPSSKAHPAS